MWPPLPHGTATVTACTAWAHCLALVWKPRKRACIPTQNMRHVPGPQLCVGACLFSLACPRTGACQSHTPSDLIQAGVTLYVAVNVCDINFEARPHHQHPGCTVTLGQGQRPHHSDWMGPSPDVPLTRPESLQRAIRRIFPWDAGWLVPKQ